MKHALLITACILLAACHSDPPVVGRPAAPSRDIKEHLINANRTVAQAEETSIDEYIARHKWTMTKLPEGARLWVYQKGSGPMVEYEDSVHLHYNIEAINGKMVYEGVNDHYVAGRRDNMIGLDQAVLNLNIGSKAKVILPSALAYGIGGDGDRIPQSAILIIDLEVLDKK